MTTPSTRELIENLLYYAVQYADQNEGELNLGACYDTIDAARDYLAVPQKAALPPILSFTAESLKRLERRIGPDCEVVLILHTSRDGTRAMVSIRAGAGIRFAQADLDRRRYQTMEDLEERFSHFARGHLYHPTAE